jgi:integrase
LCAVAAIEAWMRLVPWRSGPLVPSLRGGDIRRPDLPPPAMQTQSALQRLRRLGELAGIKVPLGAHTLRRSGARRMYDQTRNLRLVQDALRHSNPATTMGYLDDTDAAATDGDAR